MKKYILSLILFLFAFPAYAGGLTPSPSGYKLITTSYDLSTTGSLAVTGCGFKPKAIQLMALIANSKTYAWGWYDGTTNYNIFSNAFAGADLVSDTIGNVAVLFTAASNEATLTGASLDSDGVTFTKAKPSGTPTGTAVLLIMCMK